ncbi:hypothetical protein HMPREF0591_1761, partial [Mycobacterium parascrofulaceum ATCC BAA-614]
LPAILRSSQESGGPSFLILMADPRPRRLPKLDSFVYLEKAPP